LIVTLNALAEYAITVYAVLNERYPYWLFGRNYLNPSKEGLDPFLINDQQPLHSLDYLGIGVPAFDAVAAESWKSVKLKTIKGYRMIATFLASCPECEPFDPRFPHRPRLTRRWWDHPDVLERNAHNIKKRMPPILFGRGLVSGAIVTPIQIRSETIELNSQ
jgi:hypothetical protein